MPKLGLKKVSALVLAAGLPACAQPQAQYSWTRSEWESEPLTSAALLGRIAKYNSDKYECIQGARSQQSGGFVYGGIAAASADETILQPVFNACMEPRAGSCVLAPASLRTRLCARPTIGSGKGN
jgi:hypothetical protein